MFFLKKRSPASNLSQIHQIHLNSQISTKRLGRATDKGFSLPPVCQELAMQSFSLAQPPHQITALLPPVMLANKGLEAHSQCNCL